MARVMRRKRRCDDDIFYCSCTRERGSNKGRLQSTARDHCVTFLYRGCMRAARHVAWRVSINQRHGDFAAISLYTRPLQLSASRTATLLQTARHLCRSRGSAGCPRRRSRGGICFGFFLFARIAIASTRSSSVRYCARCWIRFRLRLSFLRSAVNFFR